jgi:hypothetical protein
VLKLILMTSYWFSWLMLLQLLRLISFYLFPFSKNKSAPTKAEATPTTDAILSLMVHASVLGVPMVGLMVGILVVVVEGVLYVYSLPAWKKTTIFAV